MARFLTLVGSSLFLLLTLAVTTLGCNDTPPETPPLPGGSGGNGASGGGGPGGSVNPELTQIAECSGDALRGFMSYLGTLEELLRYADDSPGHNVYEIPDGVTYDTDTYEFSWWLDVDGEGDSGTSVEGELEEGGDTGLDNGIFDMDVVLAPWT